MQRYGPYGKWISQGVNESRPQPPPFHEVKMRLLCIPPAGMGGWCFHSWANELPADVEVMPIELPARSTRFDEAVPYAASIPELARSLLDGVGLEVLTARPFVIFGHSFGAWLAYEMCQELVRRAEAGWPLPVKLYVSAYRPPQLAGIANDPDSSTPTIGGLSDVDFWVAFERRYGRNPDLQAPTTREFVIPILRADFSLIEAYVPSTSEPLSIPLCAVCACGDARCRPEQLSAWSQCCATSGGLDSAEFQERWFEDVLRPGEWATEHRYILNNPQALLRFLSTDLPLVGQPVEGYTGIAGPIKAASDPAALDRVTTGPCARRAVEANSEETSRCSVE